MSATEVSAKLVMQLRASTGLPMMKCKEALEATNGNFEKAVAWLRKKGLDMAAKKADRAMKEGRVAIQASADGKKVAMVEVDCETEPVSGGPDFKALVDGTLKAAAGLDGRRRASSPPRRSSGCPHGKETVDLAVKGLVARIGENMAARRAVVYAAAGRVGTYLHHNAKVGVVVEVTGPAAALASADVKTFLDEACKHVAFAKPVAVSRDQIAKDLVDKELEIYREQAKQDPKLSSKPAPVVEKILVGQARQVLRREVPARAALDHGRQDHRQGRPRGRREEGRRGAVRPAVRPLPGRRSLSRRPDTP